ncbi:oligosaccharide flippase family protein [Streptococcus sp. sy018]|uniref:oligosaccharide flippase family protein n=1 Tax=Streptococcus sp. sy018 TaxID=2600147 RepID=UPI0011B758FD|nr:oligosaccharide flippase family protein [Streptococcus sp. sy018]TWS94524.1 oligosaccharide flippase family protein [Streptococcus sp. sy018]
MTSKQEKQLNQAKKASLVIGLSGFISKILAASYRIPYQNLVGDRGFYAYQQVYPFLAIISTLALTAFPNFMSSVLQKKDFNSLGNLTRLLISCCWSMALLLGVCHQTLAELMGANQLGSALLAVSVLLLLTPFLSIYRGFDQGLGQMKVTAISQVLEQTIRVLVIIVAALCYLGYGWDIYRTANFAAWGNVIASCFSLIYLSLSIKIQWMRFGSFNMTFWSQLKPLFFSSFVFTLYAIYLLLFQLIDAFLLKNSLVSSGMDAIQAEYQKGIYDRGQPLLQFGLIVFIALFTSYLPKFSRLYEEDSQSYKQLSQHFLSLIYYLSLILTVGCLILLPLINQVLFNDRKGLTMLQVYMILIFLSSLVQFFHHHQFIIGQHHISLRCLVLGLVAKLLLTAPLTHYFGLVGSSWSSVLSLCIVLLAYLWISRKEFSFRFVFSYKYYLSLVVMGLLVWILSNVLPSSSRLITFLTIILSTASGVGLFVLLASKWQVFPKELWSFLPFLRKK